MMSIFEYCRDIEHGERIEDPKPRVDPALPYTWVPYYNMNSSPQQVYGALSCVWEKSPCLMRSSPVWKSGTCGVSFDELVQMCGTGDVVVMCSDATKHRFMEFDLDKNKPAGPYYVREFETQMLSMPVREFVQCCRSWSKQKLFLRATIMTYYSTVEEVDGQKRNSSFKQNILNGVFERFSEHLVNHVIDWEWLHSMLASQRFHNISKVVLEAGVQNGLIPTHYSTRDELYIQLAGRRRITLLSPDQAFGGVYPYPQAHPYDGFAMASLERIDVESWPGVGKVNLHRSILEPGQTLYVPAYWSVHVHDLAEENVSLKVVLSSQRRAPAADSTLLRLSRSLEERVAHVVGESDVKRWLNIIASGNEVKHVDLGTVQGYKRARMCQDVRDEMERSLGAGAWATALPKVTDHRLEPTPWLNTAFREPLLLTDTPKQIADTRTEEEKKYPTLFRHKLEKEGWHVPQTKSTVPIPGVNMPKDQDYRLL